VPKTDYANFSSTLLCQKSKHESVHVGGIPNESRKIKLKISSLKQFAWFSSFFTAFGYYFAERSSI